MPGSNTYSQLPQEQEQQEQQTRTVQQPVAQSAPQPVAQPQANAPVAQTNAATNSPSNYGELYTYLQNAMNEARPETPEERKKRERNEKWNGIISGISDAVRSVSNLYFTTQQAPNMYDAKNSMSAKAQERFDKAKAERQAKADKFLNYALTLGKLKDADDAKAYQRDKDAAAAARDERDFNFRVEMAQKEQDNADRNFKRQQERDDKDDAFRNRQFEEGIRQFNVQSSREAHRLAMEGKRLAMQQAQGQMSFNLGPGNGNVVLSSAQLNAQTVSRIFRTLPQKVRDNVHGQPIYTEDQFGNKVVSGYGDPSTEAMLIAIGANVQDSRETQDAIREVAGKKVEKRKIAGF